MMTKTRLTWPKLVELIGEEPAVILVRAFAQHQLPSSRHLELNERDKKIRAALDEGYTYDEVAEQFGLCKAQIQFISQFNRSGTPKWRMYKDLTDSYLESR